MTDRRRDAATLGTGSALVAGGATMRDRATTRAHEISYVRRHGRKGSLPEGPFLPSLQVKRIPKVAGRGRVRAAWLTGSGLAAVGAPAVASGAYGLTHPNRRVRKAEQRQSFLQEGVSGTTDVWRQKAKDAHHVNPLVRGLQLGVGAGTGAAGAQIGHKIIDRVAPHTHARPAVTALSGIAGGLASLPLNRRITRAATRGQYEVTATGVRRKKTAPVRPSRSARIVETRANRVATPNARQQIVPSSRRQVSKLSHDEWAARRGEMRDAYRRSSNPRPPRSSPPPIPRENLGQSIYRTRRTLGRYGAVSAVGLAGVDRTTHDHRATAGAGAGALAGVGVHQGVGAKLSRQINATEQQQRRGLTPAQRRSARVHRKKYGIPGHKVPTGTIPGDQWSRYFRTFPKDLPASGLRRTVGWTHGGRTGDAIGASLALAGAATGMNAARRRPVRKYYGEGMTPGEKRARVYAAGAIPGPAGPINAARQAARMAPPDQRRSAAALQYGGAVGGGLAGAAAGAYGTAELARRSPRVDARSRYLNTKINEARSGAAHRAVRAVPGKTGARAAQRVAEASYRTGPSRSTRVLTSLASRPGRAGTAARGVARAGRPLAAAPAAAAVGALGGKVLGGGSGGYLGYGTALHREQKRNREIRKDARIAGNMSRGEEIRQLKRKRHNAALTELGATTGAVGTGTYAGSLLAKTPKVKGKLGQVSLGTAIAGGGIGSLGGFRGARTAREDIRHREAQLRVNKHDEKSRVHLAGGHAGRPACGTGPRPASKIVQTSRLPGNVTCNACRRTREWTNQVNKRMPSLRPAVIATRRAKTGALMPVRRRSTVVKVDTTMDRNTANRYVGRYGTRGPLPRNLDRSERMKAYEGRYVALGGPKGEKWKRRSRRADQVTGGAVIVGGLGAGGQLAAETKHGAAALNRVKRSPKRVAHVSGRVALGAAAVGAGSEYMHRHAERRQASYSHSPAGVAASALRRMRDYTP